MFHTISIHLLMDNNNNNNIRNNIETMKLRLSLVHCDLKFLSTICSEFMSLCDWCCCDVIAVLYTCTRQLKFEISKFSNYSFEPPQSLVVFNWIEIEQRNDEYAVCRLP